MSHENYKDTLNSFIVPNGIPDGARGLDQFLDPSQPEFGLKKQKWDTDQLCGIIRDPNLQTQAPENTDTKLRVTFREPFSGETRTQLSEHDSVNRLFRSIADSREPFENITEVYYFQNKFVILTDEDELHNPDIKRYGVVVASRGEEFPEQNLEPHHMYLHREGLQRAVAESETAILFDDIETLADFTDDHKIAVEYYIPSESRQVRIVRTDIENGSVRNLYDDDLNTNVTDRVFVQRNDPWMSIINKHNREGSSQAETFRDIYDASYEVYAITVSSGNNQDSLKPNKKLTDLITQITQHRRNKKDDKTFPPYPTDNLYGTYFIESNEYQEKSGPEPRVVIRHKFDTPVSCNWVSQDLGIEHVKDTYPFEIVDIAIKRDPQNPENTKVILGIKEGIFEQDDDGNHEDDDVELTEDYREIQELDFDRFLEITNPYNLDEDIVRYHNEVKQAFIDWVENEYETEDDSVVHEYHNPAWRMQAYLNDTKSTNELHAAKLRREERQRLAAIQEAERAQIEVQINDAWQDIYEAYGLPADKKHISVRLEDITPEDGEYSVSVKHSDNVDIQFFTGTDKNPPAISLVGKTTNKGPRHTLTNLETASYLSDEKLATDVSYIEFANKGKEIVACNVEMQIGAQHYVFKVDGKSAEITINGEVSEDPAEIAFWSRIAKQVAALTTGRATLTVKNSQPSIGGVMKGEYPFDKFPDVVVTDRIVTKGEVIMDTDRVGHLETNLIRSKGKGPEHKTRYLNLEATEAVFGILLKQEITEGLNVDHFSGNLVQLFIESATATNEPKLFAIRSTRDNRQFSFDFPSILGKTQINFTPGADTYKWTPVIPRKYHSTLTEDLWNPIVEAAIDTVNTKKAPTTESNKVIDRFISTTMSDWFTDQKVGTTVTYRIPPQPIIIRGRRKGLTPEEVHIVVKKSNSQVEEFVYEKHGQNWLTELDVNYTLNDGRHLATSREKVPLPEEDINTHNLIDRADHIPNVTRLPLAINSQNGRISEIEPPKQKETRRWRVPGPWNRRDNG